MITAVPAPLIETLLSLILAILALDEVKVKLLELSTSLVGGVISKTGSPKVLVTTPKADRVGSILFTVMVNELVAAI